MTVFDGKRLRNDVIHLDVDALRRGLYTDRYFANVVHILQRLAAEDYRFAGQSTSPKVGDTANVDVGNLEVEAQYFHRHQPRALVTGIDTALAMLRYGTGYFDNSHFVETWADLEVESVADGTFAEYGGDPMNVRPVLKVRGRYRDFAMLETTMLGVLSRATRVANNVYRVLEVCNGKPILFFPARFDLPEVQALDGYAYYVAVQRYNEDFGKAMKPMTSTDAQALWWGGEGVGTVPHALIACFLGDTTETMVAYARHIPVEIPRIALVDFNNDVVRDSVAILNAYWPRYRQALQDNDEQAKACWTLHGVRVDTSGNVRDASLEPDGPYGINPLLIRNVRDALDRAWESWDVPESLVDAAKQFCRGVQIVASGGFDRARIEQFEREGVPVDMYGVGSRFFQNDRDTNTDFSMDVVRVNLEGRWVDMPKVGRKPCDNPDLEPVDLRDVE